MSSSFFVASTRPPIQHRVRAERDGPARDQHVTSLEPDVHVAVGVRLGQVRVLNLLVADFRGERLRVRGVERFGRQGHRRAWRVGALLPIDVVLGAHPQARELVRDDRSVGTAHGLVAARMRRVPVCVEQQLDGKQTKIAANELRELVRRLGRAAVDYGRRAGGT
jgi:hypothetical protein